MVRRQLLALALGLPVCSLALPACSDPAKLAQGHATPSVDSALEILARDTEQVRKGMPEGAKLLGKRMPADPLGNRAELQTAIKAARENVKDLMYAKSTFFSFATTEGVVLRSEIDPDRLVDQNVLKVYPDLKKALEPNAGLVEAYGEMDALRGVKRGNDIAWVVAHAVPGADDKPQGLFLSGWSMRLYIGFVQDAIRTKLEESTKGKSDQVEIYLFMLKGKNAYGHPEAPDVHMEEILKMDIVSKLGSGTFTGKAELEGKTWGVVAKKAPMFGDDAAIAAIAMTY